MLRCQRHGETHFKLSFFSNFVVLRKDSPSPPHTRISSRAAAGRPCPVPSGAASSEQHYNIQNHIEGVLKNGCFTIIINIYNELASFSKYTYC